MYLVAGAALVSLKAAGAQMGGGESDHRFRSSEFKPYCTMPRLYERKGAQSYPFPGVSV
jgi:hypothetical protein